MPRGKHSNHRRGASHPRWNKNQILSSHGYVKIRVGCDHPQADSNGYAYEHLLVWLANGNPPLKPNEVIHHRDENKKNNSIDNLELKNRVDHGVHHANGISDDDVMTMRVAYANGLADMPRLAEHYRIPVARVSKIIRGESRLSAGGPTSVRNRSSKKAAGRLLDGQEWSEFPKVSV